jgi:hypothetical protein
VEPFHFTPFGRKWLQTAPEAAGEALPNTFISFYFIYIGWSEMTFLHAFD